MFGMAIAAIAGAAFNGVSTYLNDNKLAGAYKDYANALKSAANKYSGKSAERANQNAGEQMANTFGQQDTNYLASQGMNPYQAQVQNRTNEGYNLGSQQSQQKLGAQYDNEMAKADAKLKQAGVDFKAANQAQQTAMNTAGGLVDLYNQTKVGNNGTK